VANNTNKDLTKLDTTNNLTAAADPNLTAKQVDMAATPAAKQGIAGIQSPFTNKGNIHQAVSVTPNGKETQASSIFKTTTTPQTETKQAAKTQGATDSDLLKRQQFQRDVAESDRQAAQDRLASSASLKQLGGAGAAIQEQLGAKIDKLFTKDAGLESEGIAAIAGNAELSKQFIAALPEENQTAATTAMQTIFNADKTLDDTTKTADHELAKSSMAQALADLSVALTPAGVAGDGKLSWEQITSFFPDKNKLLGTLVASGLTDQIKVDDQLLADIGYDTPDEIKELKKVLGVTGEMTYKELSDKVESYLGTEYKEVTDLENKLRDPAITADERREALSSLRDMGYTGTLASREEVSALADEIEAVGEEDTFKFGGKDYTLTEALSDSVLTGAVSDYLAGNLSAEDLPAGLVSFIEDNKKVFEAAVEDLKDEVTSYNTMQTEWQEIKSLGLPPDILVNLGFNADQKIQTKKINSDSMPLVKAILSGKDTSNNPIDVAKYKTLLTDLGVTAPAVFSSVLTNLTDKDIAKLQSDPVLAKDYTNSLRATNSLAAIKARMTNDTASDDLSGDEIISMIFGQDPDAMASGATDAIKGMSSAIENIKYLQDMGITELDSTLTAMLAVGDVRNGKALYDALVGSLGDTVTSLDSFSGKMKNGISSFTSAAGNIKELKKYEPLISSAKAGDGMGILAGLQSLGKIDGKDVVADISTAMKYLPKSLAPDQVKAVRSSIATSYVSSNPSITSLGESVKNALPGQPHWTGESARQAAVTGMDNLTSLMVSSVPEVAEIAKAKLKESLSIFTDKREGYTGSTAWADVLSAQNGLIGWEPSVPLPGFEGAFKNGGFIPVKGGAKNVLSGDYIPATPYNPRSQDLLEAITEYARMYKLPVNQDTANRFANLWAVGNLTPEALASSVSTIAKEKAGRTTKTSVTAEVKAGEKLAAKAALKESIVPIKVQEARAEVARGEAANKPATDIRVEAKKTPDSTNKPAAPLNSRGQNK
jgi:hypothetical protein